MEAHIDPASNSTRQAVAPESSDAELPVAPERVCYEAHWRNRSVFISAPCQSAREWQWHCLASAILLERLEDACVLAETMLGSSLQFFVSKLPEQCNSNPEINDGYLRVVLSRADDDVDIWLPSRAHTQVAQHRSLINASNLRWSDIQAQVKLAQVVLNDQDMSRLMIGSLMLIPASWESQWLCAVDVPQLDQSLSATLDPKAQSIVLHGRLDVAQIAHSNEDGRIKNVSRPAGNVVQAFLEPSICINPSQLILCDEHSQASDITDSTISVTLSQASCRCLVNEHSFMANLLPVGDGYGLCITEY